MQHKNVLLVILLVELCQCAVERDLLLTPKEGLQILGRTLFYDPGSNETKGAIPWEKTLKHVTYFTLFTEAGGSSNFNDLREYKKFMESPYTRIHEEYPRFGDIITMARGRLEKSNGYRFVEGSCEQYCSGNVLALWRVQKIRHRDPERGFRYEMKFSVTPFESGGATQSKHALNEQYYKSFILKDDDYPESFSALIRRSDSVENFSNERQARIVNEIPRKENGQSPHLPLLNIGEYFKEIPKASSKVGYFSSTRPDLPTTYRPNYRVKFSKPEVFEEPEEPKTVVTHHFHHHYFMKDAETSLRTNQQVYNGNPNAIRIIEGPNAELLEPQYTIKIHPAPYTSTTTTPSPPALFYMQQIPVYVQTFSQEETPNRKADSKPFKHSEQQFEEIRYSDPDPLYENIENQKSSSDSASAEIRPQVERPSLQIVTKPNSISAQLPPPADDQDSRIPYVEDEEEKVTSPPKIIAIPSSTRRIILPKNKYFVSTSTSETPLKYASKILSHKVRNYPRSTTEQPVLKWKPKRKQKEKFSSEQSEDSAQSTEEKVITVTPSKVDNADFEILTQKSVSKSISVKVGNRSEEIPLTIETVTADSSEGQDYEKAGSNENDTKP